MMDAVSLSGSTFAARVDSHVGDRIRRRRIMMGYTQEQLADSLEISYQQIQKYETGANRVSAGRLFQIAECLETEVAFFFDGLTVRSSGPVEDDDTMELSGSSRLIIDLVRSFNAITDPDVKSSVASLIKSLSTKSEDDSDTQTPRSENGASHAGNGGSHSN